MQAVAVAGGLWAWREYVDRLGSRLRARTALDRRSVFVIADGPISNLQMQRRFHTVGMESLGLCLNLPARTADMVRRVRALEPEEVHIVCAPGRLASLQPLLDELRKLPCTIRIACDVLPSSFAGLPTELVGPTAVLRMQSEPIGPRDRILKRAVDVLVAGVAIVALWPLMATVALIIKFDSPGRSIFRQRRTGYNGEVFDVLKFRSMTVEENGHRVSQATKGDERVTRVGRFCRRWSIDELPQLVNVLKGEMSLVGPRPHAVAHDEEFRARLPEYDHRFKMKPGVTGLSQVSGFRGETPTDDLIARRVDLDRWYVEHWSLWLDVKIILKTFVAIFNERGAH
jgi:exopolysaccharide biosynthesis polyprenyl glycosylphosphotransferase